jgi:hypothetical protein
MYLIFDIFKFIIKEFLFFKYVSIVNYYENISVFRKTKTLRRNCKSNVHLEKNRTKEKK